MLIRKLKTAVSYYFVLSKEIGQLVSKLVTDTCIIVPVNKKLNMQITTSYYFVFSKFAHGNYQVMPVTAKNYCKYLLSKLVMCRVTQE